MTLKVVEPVTVPDIAGIVAFPTPTAVATPEALIVATPVFEDVQLTEPVKFSAEPSLKVPVAVNCWAEPVVSASLAGVTWMELKVPSTSSGVLPDIDPEVAVIVVVP